MFYFLYYISSIILYLIFNDFYLNDVEVKKWCNHYLSGSTNFTPPYMLELVVFLNLCSTRD